MGPTQIYFFLLVFYVSHKVGKTFDCHKTDDGKRCQKWDKLQLTYSLSQELPDEIQNRREEFLRDLKMAFEQWSKWSGLSFIEVTNIINADIKIHFHKESHGDCNRLNVQQANIKHGKKCTYDFDGLETLAHSFPPEHMAHGEPSTLRGELHFNAEEKWKPVSDCIDDNEKCSQWKNKDWFKTWCDNRKPHSYFGNMPLASACPSCCDGWSFHPIALHEIGHLLGLDHSYDRSSVMYFESYADGLRNDLHDDDIRGITCLYGDELCEEFQFATTPAFNIEGAVPIIIAVGLCIICIVSFKFYMRYREHHRVKKMIENGEDDEDDPLSTKQNSVSTQLDDV